MITIMRYTVQQISSSLWTSLFSLVFCLIRQVKRVNLFLLSRLSSQAAIKDSDIARAGSFRPWDVRGKQL
jgi:hypothetical protein